MSSDKTVESGNSSSHCSQVKTVTGSVGGLNPEPTSSPITGSPVSECHIVFVNLSYMSLLLCQSHPDVPNDQILSSNSAS